MQVSNLIDSSVWEDYRKMGVPQEKTLSPLGWFPSAQLLASLAVVSSGNLLTSLEVHFPLKVCIARCRKRD